MTKMEWILLIALLISLAMHGKILPAFIEGLTEERIIDPKNRLSWLKGSKVVFFVPYDKNKKYKFPWSNGP